MGNMEVLNKEKQVPATTEIKNIGEKMKEGNGDKLGDKIKEKRANIKENRAEKKMLKNSPEKVTSDMLQKRCKEGDDKKVNSYLERKLGPKYTKPDNFKK